MNGTTIHSWLQTRFDALSCPFIVPVFPGSSDSKASACNTGDLGSIPGSEDPLEKKMATHSSILAWKIPWTEEPSRLQSIGSQRVRHYWVTSLFIVPCINCVLYICLSHSFPCWTASFFRVRIMFALLSLYPVPGTWVLHQYLLDKLRNLWRNFLVIQGLGLCTLTAEGPGSILSWGTKIP